MSTMQLSSFTHLSAWHQIRLAGDTDHTTQLPSEWQPVIGEGGRPEIDAVMAQYVQCGESVASDINEQIAAPWDVNYVISALLL